MTEEEIQKIIEIISRLMDEKITNEMMYGTKSREMWNAIQEAIEEIEKELKEL